MDLEALSNYGLIKIGKFAIINDQFTIDISDKAMIEQVRCIYAFVIDGKIVRIGSSKAPLKKRMASWRSEVTKALKGERSQTPIAEASKWKELLSESKCAELFARQGSTVATPVGEIITYLDEESVLIGRYSPVLNRSKHR